MKKVLCSISLMLLAVVLVGCGGNTQADAGARLATTLDGLSKATTRVVTISNADLKINELNRNMGINTADGVNNFRRNNVNSTSRRNPSGVNSDYELNGAQYNRRLIRNQAYNTNNGSSYNTMKNPANTYNRNVYNNSNTARNVYNQNVGSDTYNGVYNNSSGNAYQNANRIDAFDNQRNVNRGVTQGVNQVYNNNGTANTSNTFTTDTGSVTNRTTTARYTPRFLRGAAVETTDGLSNYVERIEDLYMISLDSCAANDKLNGVKNELSACCTNSRNLVDQIRTGQITLTPSEINTLNQYNATLLNSLNNVNKTNLASRDVQTIVNLKKNFSENCDSLTAKYLRVLNNMDVCISSCNAAKSTVVELNNFINSLINRKTSEGTVNNLANTNYENRFNNTTNNTQNSGNTAFNNGTDNMGNSTISNGTGISNYNANRSNLVNNNYNPNTGVYNTNSNNMNNPSGTFTGNRANNNTGNIVNSGNSAFTNNTNTTIGQSVNKSVSPSATRPTNDFVRNLSSGVAGGVDSISNTLSNAADSAVNNLANTTQNKIDNLANGANNLINRSPTQNKNNIGIVRNAQKNVNSETPPPSTKPFRPDLNRSANNLTQNNGQNASQDVGVTTLPTKIDGTLLLNTTVPSPISKKVRA